LLRLSWSRGKWPMPRIWWVDSRGFCMVFGYISEGIMVTDIMLDRRAVEAVKAALEEDVGAGDATTLALVDPAVEATGEILARQACRVSGATVAAAVMQRVEPV
jgi:Quinolinate phosphoribosyl transferase, N-terminal domain